MKSHVGAVLRPAQERYLERLLPPRDELVAEMEAVAAEEGIPISDPEVARLLESVAAARQARRAVEVGCAIGYGALHLARGSAQAEVVSIDRDAAVLERARGYLERAGVADRVRLLHGPALEVLASLEGPFDVAYVDAAKTEYRRYLDLLLPQMSVGGVLVFDNLLWKGLVAEPPEDGEEDEQTRALRAFNPYLMIHPQLRSVLLPLGDGVGLATKIQPTILEMGGPF
jgi:predicted O-methyltransferase YrrM